jgi:hypothetical protein
MTWEQNLCTKVAKGFGKILNAHALVSSSTGYAGLTTTDSLSSAVNISMKAAYF